MQEITELITQSFKNVSSDGYFAWAILFNFLTAIGVGAVSKKWVKSLRSYFIILFPYLINIGLPTVLRIINTSKEYPISFNAINSTSTLIISSLIYFAGILIGYLVVTKAHNDAVREVSKSLGTI